jgi:phosphoribosyl-ATP pyrophosphohydrolase
VKTFEELFAELRTKAADRTPDPGRSRRWTAACARSGRRSSRGGRGVDGGRTRGSDRAAVEIAQLLYQAQVLMLASGLDLDDVYRHL